MENKAVAVRMMVCKEARDCVEKINANMANVRHLVLDLYERKGWDALGYANWRDCVTKEFEIGQSHIYRLLDAAQIEHNISPIGEKEIPESQLRPLSKLTPEQQSEGWKRSVATAPDGKVTAAHVQKVVREMMAPVSVLMPEPAPKKPDGKVKEPMVIHEPVGESFQKAFKQMVEEIKNARALKWKETSHTGALEMMQTLVTITEG